MKLLSNRKDLCDRGVIKMCMAEYNGSWLPYEQSFDDVTYEWLLEELTYDDCIRKDEIINYLISKFKGMEKQVYMYHELKENLTCVFSHIK